MLRRVSSDHRQQYAEIGIAGDPAEIESLERMLTGDCYVINDPREGVLHVTPRHRPLPEPVDDPLIAPHWAKAAYKQPRLIEDHIETDAWHSPHFSMQHLGAMGGNYAADARRAESYGFVCLRSRRGPEGQFWEVWYLCGAWDAQGDLKAFLDIRKKKGALTWHEEAKLISKFLAENIRFGTLDVSVQRMAMVID